MTRQQAIEKHHDRLMGMLLKAANMKPDGLEMWMWLKAAVPNARELVGEIYDEGAATALAPANGHANGVAPPKRN